MKLEINHQAYELLLTEEQYFAFFKLQTVQDLVVCLQSICNVTEEIKTLAIDGQEIDVSDKGLPLPLKQVQTLLPLLTIRELQRLPVELVSQVLSYTDAKTVHALLRLPSRIQPPAMNNYFGSALGKQIITAHFQVNVSLWKAFERFTQKEQTAGKVSTFATWFQNGDLKSFLALINIKNQTRPHGKDGFFLRWVTIFGPSVIAAYKDVATATIEQKILYALVAPINLIEPSIFTEIFTAESSAVANYSSLVAGLRLTQKIMQIKNNAAELNPIKSTLRDRQFAYINFARMVFQGVNLSGANLSSANLSAANLNAACLSRVNLSGANLSRAILSCAALEHATLVATNFNSANLSSANLLYANLSSANLQGVNLSNATLTRATLISANLSSAILSSANLYGATLVCANLSAANLYDTNLSSATLSHAKLQRANLIAANLSSVNLENVDLYSANLSDAKLYDANLSSANLSGANLNDAELHRVNLSYAKLAQATLVGANLSSATLDGTYFYAANLSGANLSSANLITANFQDANLSTANLSGAKLKNVSFVGANLEGTNLCAITWGYQLEDFPDFQDANLAGVQMDFSVFNKLPLSEDKKTILIHGIQVKTLTFLRRQIAQAKTLEEVDVIMQNNRNGILYLAQTSQLNVTPTIGTFFPSNIDRLPNSAREFEAIIAARKAEVEIHHHASSSALPIKQEEEGIDRDEKIALEAAETSSSSKKRNAVDGLPEMAQSNKKAKTAEADAEDSDVDDAFLSPSSSPSSLQPF